MKPWRRAAFTAAVDLNAGAFEVRKADGDLASFDLTSSGDDGYLRYLDYNGDGVVDFSDWYDGMRPRYGTTQPGAALSA